MERKGGTAPVDDHTDHLPSCCKVVKTVEQEQIRFYLIGTRPTVIETFRLIR